MKTFDQYVRDIEARDSRSLMEYLRVRLSGGPTEPPVNLTQDEEPEGFVEAAYSYSRDLAFKGRLKAAIKDLLAGWRPSEEDAAYGARLIHLCGALQCEEATPLLRSLAKWPEVGELAFEGDNLRDLALRALLAYPGEEDPRDFWKNLLEDPGFVETAFIALARRDAVDAARHALPVYLDCMLDQGREPEVELELASFVLEDLGERRLAELAPALRKLDLGKRQRVLDMLDRFQINFESLRDLNARLRESPALREYIQPAGMPGTRPLKWPTGDGSSG